MSKRLGRVASNRNHPPPPPKKNKSNNPSFLLWFFLDNKTFPTKPQRIRTTAVVAWPQFPWHCVVSCQGNPSLHLETNDWKVTPLEFNMLHLKINPWKRRFPLDTHHLLGSSRENMEPNFPKLWFKWFSFRIFWGTFELLWFLLLNFWGVPLINTLQGTITYPTKGKVRKIINSKVTAGRGSVCFQVGYIWAAAFISVKLKGRIFYRRPLPRL